MLTREQIESVQRRVREHGELTGRIVPEWPELPDLCVMALALNEALAMNSALRVRIDQLERQDQWKKRCNAAEDRLERLAAAADRYRQLTRCDTSDEAAFVSAFDALIAALIDAQNQSKCAPPMDDLAELRAAGWKVAVHNDYTLNGESYTFWLFTRAGRCVKGEGRTDSEAIAIARAAAKEVT